MLLKPAFFIFLAILAGHIAASEIVTQDGIPTAPPALTREDLHVLSKLIKKEFSVQGYSLKKEEGMLIQISSSIDALKAAQSQESATLDKLFFIYPSLCIIFILQALGLWRLLRKDPCFADVAGKDPNENSLSTMVLDPGSLKGAPFLGHPPGDINVSIESGTLNPEVHVNSKEPIENIAYITNIRIEKATALFSGDLADDRTAQQNFDASDSNISALVAIGAKIRLQGFEKIASLHMHMPPKTNYEASSSIRYKHLLKQKKLRALLATP